MSLCLVMERSQEVLLSKRFESDVEGFRRGFNGG